MKKKYLIPFAETVNFDVCDILRTSGEAGEVKRGGGNGDWWARDLFPKKEDV